MRFGLKKAIPRPRSLRDRALKRKYGDLKFQRSLKIEVYKQRHRKIGSSRLEISSGMIRHATILRKWNFPSETVIQKNPTQPRVKIQFRYEKTTKTATVIISGLKRGSFEDSIVAGN